MRGGREFKSGNYFRSHRDDNAISAFTRKDLSWRVRHCAFRPDVSIVVKLPPLSLIDFLLPLSSPISPSGLMEPAKRFSLSLVSPLSSNRIIRKMAENIAKYSRLITDRWKDGGDKGEEGRGEKGEKRFDHGNYVKLRGKRGVSFFLGREETIYSACTCVYVCRKTPIPSRSFFSFLPRLL